MKIKLLGVMALILGVALAPVLCAGTASVVGELEVSWVGAYGPQTGTLRILGEADGLEGSFLTEGMEGALRGTFDAPKLTFTIEQPSPDGGVSRIEGSAVVEGDTMKGTVIDNGLEIPFTGKRKVQAQE